MGRLSAIKLFLHSLQGIHRLRDIDTSGVFVPLVDAVSGCMRISLMILQCCQCYLSGGDWYKLLCERNQNCRRIFVAPFDPWDQRATRLQLSSATIDLSGCWVSETTAFRVAARVMVRGGFRIPVSLRVMKCRGNSMLQANSTILCQLRTKPEWKAVHKLSRRWFRKNPTSRLSDKNVYLRHVRMMSGVSHRIEISVHRNSPLKKSPPCSS